MKSNHAITEALKEGHGKEKAVPRLNSEQLKQVALRLKKRRAKKGKGTKANPYAIGLGPDVPKTRGDVTRHGEPR